MRSKTFRSFSIVLLLLFINLTIGGCYYTGVASLDNSKSFKIEKIEMKDGSTLKFIYDKVEYAYYINNEIIVYTPKDGKERRIPMNEVKKVYVSKFNGPGTIFLVISGVVVLYFAFALLSYYFRSNQEIPSTY